MKPDRVVYYESIETVSPTGLKHWIKKGMEAPVAEHEDAVEEWCKLRDKVVGLNTHNGLRLSDEYGPNPNLPPQPLKEVNIAADRLEIMIENATTLEDLAKLKDDAAKYGMVNIYMKKLQSIH